MRLGSMICLFGSRALGVPLPILCYKVFSSPDPHYQHNPDTMQTQSILHKDSDYNPNEQQS